MSPTDQPMRVYTIADGLPSVPAARRFVYACPCCGHQIHRTFSEQEHKLWPVCSRCRDRVIGVPISAVAVAVEDLPNHFPPWPEVVEQAKAAP